MAKTSQEETTVSSSPHLVDLLYPDEGKRQRSIERGSAIAKLPQDYVQNLELELLSRLICPENSLNALRVLTQLSTDPEVLNYRLDILEDFLNVPQLEAVLYENVHKPFVNRLKINLLSAGNDYAAHAFGDVSAFKNGSGNP